MDYSSGSDKRNKGKDKRKEQKKHPYTHGGKNRAANISTNQ